MDERAAGWVLFAGIVLIWGGIMKIFDANWAFRYHGVLPSNLEAGIFGHSLKTYAWVDLGVAAILLICGVLVIKGSRFARWAAVERQISHLRYREIRSRYRGRQPPRGR